MTILILAVLMKIRNLKSSNFYHFRNDEHFLFFYGVLDLINRIGAAALKIQKEFEVFRACFDNEDEALKKISKSAATAKINDADAARDITFRGMVDTNTIALNHYDPEVAEAAQSLKIPFDTYGNLAKLPLKEETSGIINLLQELKGKYAAAVQKAGLTGWVAKLEADNNTFFTLFTERNDENAARTHLKMKECRLETERAYDAVVERINALIVIEGEAYYAEFVSKLNSLIDKFNNDVAVRIGRAKAKANKKNEDKD
jgi:hypothetical protein